MNVISKFACAAVFAGVVGGASAASATDLFLVTGGYYTAGNATVDGLGTHPAGAFWFEANYGGSQINPQFDVYGFCIDLYHTISIGINTQTALNLAYHNEPFMHDASGTGTGVALDATQKQLIMNLANYGASLARNGDLVGNSDGVRQKLGGVQAAIWGIEYKKTVTVDAALQTAFDEALALTGAKKAYAFYSNDNYRIQAFITDVPEPGVWALMITGFGLAGVALRRRRVLAA